LVDSQEGDLGESYIDDGAATTNRANYAMAGAQAGAADTANDAQQAVTKAKSAAEQASEKVLTADREVHLEQSKLQAKTDAAEAQADKVKELDEVVRKAEAISAKDNDIVAKDEAAAKAAGVADTEAATAVATGGAKVDGETAALHEARSYAHRMKMDYVKAKSALSLATPEYEKAKAALSALVGGAESDEQLEQKAKEKQEQFEKNKDKALNAFNKAKHAVANAEADEQAALKRENDAQMRNKELIEDEKKAKDRAKKLHEEYEEAKKNGTATEEMAAAAKAAATAADNASKALSDQTKVLEDLKRQTREKARIAQEARDKASALEKLLHAEEALVADITSKRAMAKDAENLAEQDLGKQKVKVENAEIKVTSAKHKKEDAIEGKEAEETKLSIDLSKLAREKTELEITKQREEDTRKSMDKATNIEVPANTEVNEANMIIDKKNVAVKEETNGLVKAIEDQKAALTATKTLEIKVNHEKTEIKHAEFEIGNADDKLTWAEKVERKEMAKETTDRRHVEEKKEEVADETGKLGKATSGLADVKSKLKQADKVIKEADMDADKMKKTATAEADKVKAVEHEAEVAAEQVEEVSKIVKAPLTAGAVGKRATVFYPKPHMYHWNSTKYPGLEDAEKAMGLVHATPKPTPAPIIVNDTVNTPVATTSMAVQSYPLSQTDTPAERMREDVLVASLG